MKIALVSDVYLPTVSGVAASSDSIARFLAFRGHDVTLICPRPLVAFTPDAVPGLRYVYTPGVSDGLFVNKSMTPFPFGFATIFALFRSSRFDVVHIQEPASLGISALIAAKIFRIPVVGALHLSWAQVERIAPWFVRWISVPFMKLYVFLIYRNTNAIMVPTETSAVALKKLMGQHSNIHAISNGVDTDVFSPGKSSKASLRKRYGISAGTPVFLYIGRLDADKNIETILRAFALAGSVSHLVIAGVGRQEAALRTLAEDLKLPRVTWVGGVQQREMIDLYRLADAFVIMSPVETQSIVALQAIACGLPLIAARAGALPELVDGTNGYLVDAYDVQSLAGIFRNVAADASARTAMGKRSRELSLAHHKPNVLLKLESLYRSLTRTTDA